VAACMDSTVTVTTVLTHSGLLSAVVAKAWWEDGHVPKNLQQYMKDGILTMSSGAKDLKLTLMPYLTPAWSADYTYEMRTVIR
jgi:hypothetical protein